MARDDVRIPEIEEPIPRAAFAPHAEDHAREAERPRAKPLWELLRLRWSAAAALKKRD